MTARPQLAKADIAFQAHPLANRLNEGPPRQKTRERPSARPPGLTAPRLPAAPKGDFGRGLSALSANTLRLVRRRACARGRMPRVDQIELQHERGRRRPMAAKNKCLAQISKTGARIRATKGHRPDGYVGEAKNKHLLPPLQSEEAEFDPALLTRGPIRNRNLTA